MQRSKSKACKMIKTQHISTTRKKKQRQHPLCFTIQQEHCKKKLKGKRESTNTEKKNAFVVSKKERTKNKKKHLQNKHNNKHREPQLSSKSALAQPTTRKQTRDKSNTIKNTSKRFSCRRKRGLPRCGQQPPHVAKRKVRMIEARNTTN